MQTKRVGKTISKDEGLLVNFARTIGSTLGAVVAKTEGLSKPSLRQVQRKKSASKARHAGKKVKI